MTYSSHEVSAEKVYREAIVAALKRCTRCISVGAWREPSPAARLPFALWMTVLSITHQT